MGKGRAASIVMIANIYMIPCSVMVESIANTIYLSIRHFAHCICQQVLACQYALCSLLVTNQTVNVHARAECAKRRQVGELFLVESGSNNPFWSRRH